MMSTVAQKYEAEQARLRRQEGADDGQVHIEAPKPPEINPEIIRDVEPLLFRGFLHVPAEINGVPFVFKSLNHHEYEHLSLMVNLSNQHGTRRFYDLFLAYGVLMVDGSNVLAGRDQWIHEIANTFGSFDDRSRRKVIRYLSEINRRASRATILTEVYCMEPQSRLRWSQYHQMDLTLPSVTGFSGTQHLGMNWAQLTWRAVNYFEDQKDGIEREWENTKFIAGAFAGSKGLSSINAQDKQRREREQNEKVERRDRILRAVVLGESWDAKDPKKGAPMKVARTVEELADQLEKDLRGEKDWHDQVVEDHERRAQAEYAGRMQKLQEFREAHVEKYGDRPVFGGTEVLRGLTQEEVQQRLEKRRQETAQRLASPKAFPEVHDPRMAQFRQKWANVGPKRGKD